MTPRELLGSVGSRLRSLWSNPVALSAVGVAAAGLLLVQTNVLSARHYRRWDLSASQRYTPSPAARDFLQRLPAPVQVTVLLSSSDPLLVDVKHTLGALAAVSNRLELHYVDPDRNAAEFLALGREYDLSASEGVGGVTVADAALLVTQGQRRRFVRSSELLTFDDEGRRHPRIEGATVEAIARTLDSTHLVACFVTGHGEKSLDDTGPEGLSELAHRLELANLAPRRTPLDVPDPDGALGDCELIAVVGPARPFPDSHADAVQRRFQAGADVLLLLDPIVDGEGRLTPVGLASLTELAGVTLPGGFVLERAPDRRLPQGLGEAFLATPSPHPITSGLSTESARLDAQVVVISAQPLDPVPNHSATPLLTTSDRATILADLRRLEVADDDGTGPYVIAAASRPTPGDAPAGSTPGRMVIAGTSNIADNRASSDPTQYGSRVFVDGAVSWLSERPALVPLPEGPELPPGLRLTEESLSSLLRYVLFYMPMTSALLGVFVLLRRRRTEETGRDSHGGGDA